MGRYNLSAQRVHTHATNLLRNSANTQAHAFPPPWYNTIAQVPPAERLTRPLLRRTRKVGKKSARMFSPANVTYKEDRLRYEYFNDHPWELARPRVVLEKDGRDAEQWDWSIELDIPLNAPRSGLPKWEETVASQSGRPLNGEAVIQRQKHLLHNTTLTPPAAYDKARKELYRIRHFREIERRVAKEEALSTGAVFGLGPLEIGMQLEDKAYRGWKDWAMKESERLRQVQGAAYTGTDAEEGVDSEEAGGDGGSEEAQAQEVAESVPGSKKGQRALGGEAVHP